MIRPIIATKNPHETAGEFHKCGWHIDFQTPPDSGDPLAGVSLYGNQLLLGTMDEKYVPAKAAPHIGAGVEIHVLIPANSIQQVYQNHLCLNPTKLEEQPWGELGFKFSMQDYRFMILTEAIDNFGKML